MLLFDETTLELSKICDDEHSFFAEKQLLKEYESKFRDRRELSRSVTFQIAKQLPVHNWFQYTQGFSPSLVDHYLDQWKADKGGTILDPFVGSGTSLIVGQSRGINSYGWDLSPLAIFLCKVKTSQVKADKIKNLVDDFDKYNGIPKQNLLLEIPPKLKDHFIKSFPPVVLDQLMLFQNWINQVPSSIERDFVLCAAIASLESVSYFRKHGSHYRFMNTNNTGVQRQLKFDKLDFVKSFKQQLNKQLSEASRINRVSQSFFEQADSRTHTLPKNVKADWIITSPPYLNRNNYIAQSKTEMFFAGLLESFSDYRELTQKTLRSHVEAIPQFKTDFEFDLVDKIVGVVKKRGESYKGVNQMIKGYFEDMHSSLQNLVNSTHSNSKIAIVVGCSRWSGVVVPTDLLIGKIAEMTGFYELESVDIVRYKGNAPQQMAKYGRYPVRESVVVLKRK